MKLIKIKDACGQVLCHDMTQIIPGQSKTTAFRKGHVIQQEDIPALLGMGRENIYVWEKPEGMLHEEEGAERLRDLCRGANLRAEPAREGKVELFAERAGVFKVNSEKIIRLNSIGGIAVVTKKGNRGIGEGEKLAALKIVPLLIEKEKLDRAAEICGSEKIFNVLPYTRKKAGLIISGSELYHKRKPDTGSAILRAKLEAFPAECAETAILPDDDGQITAKILAMIEGGMDLIICTGGMSVDPDDRTPLAIKNSGARIVSYGVPLMPGTMLLLAYFEKGGARIPVIGAPACVFHDQRTALDMFLPRLMASDPISREEIALLGEGGLDLS
ncbi:MAG: molybdopterin-binding protein [Treponema sp.]|jgi:molybdopterin biosynthesis enzyme|nr:molybdopterin-binding protein [Treponema sp.]